MFEFEGRIKDDVSQLPTFAQWIKSSNSAEHKPIRPVVKVWLPNRFENLTFETEVFRLRVDKRNPIYEPLIKSIPAAVEQEVCLAIKILDATQGEYSIISLQGETADWEELGAFGYKLTVKEKKRSKRAP